jgi:hypothetical protein
LTNRIVIFAVRSSLVTVNARLSASIRSSRPMRSVRPRSMALASAMTCSARARWPTQSSLTWRTARKQLGFRRRGTRTSTPEAASRHRSMSGVKTTSRWLSMITVLIP